MINPGFNISLSSIILAFSNCSLTVICKVYIYIAAGNFLIERSFINIIRII